MHRQTTTAPVAHGRRDFLKVLGGGALASALVFNRLSAAAKPGSKPIHGLFPIGSTPFTDSDKLDLECLAAEIKFLNRGGVHGVIWPQIASEWTMLTKQERLDGAEAMVAAGKGGKTAITIGVQGPDIATVLEYTKHADKIGADAICSLPPEGVTDDNALFDYYKAIATALARDALWEYQGTVELGPGLHWLRVQDVLPDILGIRLEPVASSARPAIPWPRYPVPEGRFLGGVRPWESQPLHGAAKLFYG